MSLSLKLVSLVGLLAPLASAQEAWVSNTTAGTVSVLDTESLAVVATFPVGVQPGRIAFTADGERALVPNAGADTLTVVSVDSRTVTATIQVNDGPSLVVLLPGERAYVGGFNGVVGVVDLAAGVMTGTIVLGAPATGYSVSGLALSSDGERVYANWGELHELDVASDTVTRSLFAGISTTALALTADGSKAYVSAAFGYPAFSFYGSVVVVDLASWSVAGSIFTWSLPTQLSLNAAGTEAHVSTPSTFVDTGYGAGYLSSPWVARLDLTTSGLDGGTNAGAAASGHVMSRDETRLFVAVPTANAVKVIARATDALVATIPVGTGPTHLTLVPTQAASAKSARAAVPTGRKP